MFCWQISPNSTFRLNERLYFNNNRYFTPLMNNEGSMLWSDVSISRLGLHFPKAKKKNRHFTKKAFHKCSLKKIVETKGTIFIPIQFT